MLPSGPKSTGPAPRCGELQLAGGARGGSFVPDIAPGARWGRNAVTLFQLRLSYSSLPIAAQL